MRAWLSRREEASAEMWQALVKTARRLVTDLNRTWAREQAPVGRPRRYLPAVCEELRPLRRVTLTDEVTRTLFEELSLIHI